MNYPNFAVRVRALLLLVFFVTSFGRQAATAGQTEGGFIATGSMITPRESHAAALLPNGWVLIAGGQAVISQEDCCNFAPLSSAELYNPSTGTFAATGGMTVARAFPVAVTLPSGKVLVADDKSADLYDPSSASFSATGSPNFSNPFIWAILLKTGKVLLTDGSSAELYDPSSGALAPTGSPQVARRAFSTTLLNNGEVLIAGGSGSNYATLSSAELYDPSTGTFALTGSMTQARGSHVAALIGGSAAQAGDVLVVGGHAPTPPGGPDVGVPGAEIYDSSTGQFTFDPNPYGPDFGGTATTLSDGRVLIAGGAGTEDGGGGTDNLAAIYDPSSTTPPHIGSVTTLQARAFHSATLLPNSEVLVAGGDNGGVPNVSGCCTQLASAELFDQSAGSAVHIWAPTSGLWWLGSAIVDVWTDSSVKSVNVYLDRKNLAFSPPFIDLDTATLSDGPHTLLAIGLAGAPQRTNLGSDSIIINVVNHQIGISSPLSGEPFSGDCLPLSLLPAYPGERIRNYLDGKYQNSSSNPCISTSGLRNGLHTFSTVGFNRNGKVVGKDFIVAHVVNPPLQGYPKILSPLSGTGASATITVRTTVPQANVQWFNLYIDGTYFASSPRTSFSIDTSKLRNRKHTISLRAYDSSKQQVSSDQIVIDTVN